MNGIKNETRVWYCHICDKTSTIKSKLKHISSETHKHKQKIGIIVKEYGFIKPDIDEVKYILDDTIKDFRKKYFHSFEFGCIYDINFSNITNNEEVNLTTGIGYMEFKSQFYGISKKVKNV